MRACVSIRTFEETRKKNVDYVGDTGHVWRTPTLLALD